MEKIRLLDQIQDSKDLLSIPQILGEVLEAVEADNTSPDTIAKIILKDASLTAKVLRMANSSYYSRNSEITTVQQGVRVLGVNAIKMIALSVSIMTKPRVEVFGDFDIRSVYFHMLGVGILTRTIAEKVEGVNSEEAFVAGLLHDLGRLYTMNLHPQALAEVQKRVSEGEDIIQVERDIFDVDHAELGAIIAANWHLPRQLQDVMRLHHAQGIADDPVINIVKIANMVTNSIYSTNLKTVERQLIEISKHTEPLGLDREFINSLTFVLLDETIDAAGHLGVDIGDTADLLSRANRELCKAYLMVEGMFKERQELSGRLLAEERSAGMVRSMNIAIATLSHYLNNVATAISGRVQLMQMQLQNGDLVDKKGKMPQALEVIEASINKMMAVLTELKTLTNMEDEAFYNSSDAINIDERIKQRLQIDEPVGVQT
jgi:putative nucleotidyltransferase with HDIG domain